MDKQDTKVLVVDDHSSLRSCISAILGLEGYSNIRLANDGMQALEMADDYRPHVVVMDTSMPRMDGITACKELRAREYGNNMAIIGMSLGNEFGHKRTAYLDAGADDFIDKSDLADLGSHMLDDVIQRNLAKYQA
ncbi:MAG: response regulator [Nanoarchaeota archaeon]|nr:response regulator [Nanoarchaeota archaeon]MBU1705031.1 response regulator [Nanoarchaeota archaeon]